MGDPNEDWRPGAPFFDYRYKLDPTLFPSYEDKPRFRLLDEKLRLDPDLLYEIERLEAHLSSEALLARILRPDWKLLELNWKEFLAKSDPDPLTLQLPAVRSRAFEPGKGPEVPKPAEMSDLLDAVYKVPQVQGWVKQARDHGLKEVRLLKAEWEAAKTPEKIAMVSVGGLVVGTMVGSILAAKPTRELTLKFLDGRDIPTPIEGLSVKLLVADEAKKKGWGGGFTTPLGVKGLSAGASLRARDGQGPDLNINVTFDIAKFWGGKDRK